MRGFNPNFQPIMDDMTDLPGIVLGGIVHRAAEARQASPLDEDDDLVMGLLVKMKMASKAEAAAYLMRQEGIRTQSTASEAALQ